MKVAKTLLLLALAIAPMALVAVLAVMAVSHPTLAAEAAEATGIDPGALRWGLLAGAAAASVSAVAAAYAVAQVGTAAVGVLAEKPELMGRVLILVGLAEGIAIYGLIVAILIFNRVS